jgi:hypothetical protein
MITLDAVNYCVQFKADELKKMQKNYQGACEEKEKWFLQYNIEKNCNAKLEKQVGPVIVVSSTRV